MRSLALATVMTVLAASSAHAFCQPLPDNASTFNVQNNTAQALCLQQELARQAAADAQQARIEAMIGNMQIESERQQQMIYDRMNQQLFNNPGF